MSGTLFVEIILHKHEIGEIPKQVIEKMSRFKVFESPDQINFNLPLNWSGFSDSILIKTIKGLGTGAYVALAYYTEDSSEIVTDMYGNKLEPFESVVDKKVMLRYLKKALRIIKIYDHILEIFSVKQYNLNLKYNNPVVKALDVYSIGSMSSIKLDTFIQGSK